MKLKGKLDCPECGYVLDAATSAYEKQERHPQDGDLGMCICCGTFLRYRVDKKFELSLEKLSTDDLVDLPSDTRNQLTKAHEVWTYLHKDKKL